MQLFQSAPGREAGRCAHRRTPALAQYRFNPRPAVRPGDAGVHRPAHCGTTCFNPRPAVRPGDADRAQQLDEAERVSIRARP